MKLSMALLARYLKQYYSLTEEIKEDPLSISGVRFLEDDRKEILPNYVYVGEMTAFSSDPKYKASVLLASGKSRVICHGGELEEICNDVLGAFEFYSDWENKMKHMAAVGAHLQEMLDHMVEVIDENMFISDIPGQLLAVSICKEIDKSQYRLNKTLEEGGASPEFMSSCFYSADGKETEPRTIHPKLIFEQPTLENHQICMYLCRDSEPIAVLFVAEPALEAVPLYQEILENMAHLLTEAREFTSPDSLLRSGRSILRDLLENRQISEEAEQRLKIYNGITEPYILVVVSHIIQNDAPQRRAIVRALMQLSIETVVTEYQNTVVAMMSALNLQMFQNQFGISMQLQNFRLGVSLPFGNIKQVSMAWQQAIFALQYAKKGEIVCCQQIAFFYLMRTLNEQPMTGQLLHPAIGILRQYDQKNQTCLLQTLRCYLDNQCNHRMTAEKLFIHRNTLTLRLERITQLTGVQFEMETERKYLELSLWLDNIR